jgi:hypothetical protein
LPQPDSASPEGDKLSDPVKFIDDSASTCDDDMSSLSAETEMGDCSEPASPTLTWAEQMMEESISPKSCPPGIWAMPSESFAIPPGQWMNTLGMLPVTPAKVSSPPGNVGAPPGIFSKFATENLVVPPGKLTGPPGNLCAPPGNLMVSPGVAVN